MGVHVILIIIIGLVSVTGFSNREVVDKLQFNAWKIIHKKEYYRLLTHALVHADWMHLLVNVFVLYMFGQGTIMAFSYALGINGQIWFLVLFITAIVLSSLYSLVKEKDNYYYNALGASGGVMAIVFTTIVFEPYNLIYVYFIPVPAIIFGVGYLVYSRIMARKNVDNVGHDAHFWGALYGFFFPIILRPELAKIFFEKLISIL